MKCLFIGGHAAGKIIDVDIRQAHVRVPFCTQTTAVFSAGNQEPVDSVFEEETYKWGFLADRDGKRISIYVADGVDPLAELMEFYEKNQLRNT